MKTSLPLDPFICLVAGKAKWFVLIVARNFLKTSAIFISFFSNFFKVWCPRRGPSPSSPGSQNNLCTGHALLVGWNSTTRTLTGAHLVYFPPFTLVTGLLLSPLNQTTPSHPCRTAGEGTILPQTTCRMTGIHGNSCITRGGGLKPFSLRRLENFRIETGGRYCQKSYSAVKPSMSQDHPKKRAVWGDWLTDIPQ